MRLNIKKPDTKVHMYEKKSNTVSIIVAVAAVLLIFGGIYLIDQGVRSANSETNNSETSETETSTTTVANNISSDTMLNESQDSDNETETDTDEDATNNSITTTPITRSSNRPADNSSAATTSQEIEESQTSENDSTVDSEEQDDTETNSEESDLAEDEAIIEVLKSSPLDGGLNRYDIRVEDTGFPDGVKLIKGAETFINVSGVTLEEGKTYRMTSIVEKDGRISISSLRVQEVE
ncbi:MAG: hypothetical protein AAGF07_03640 [Patescibacteria group bacterium]